MSYGDGDGDRDGERDAAVCCVCVCVCVCQVVRWCVGGFGVSLILVGTFRVPSNLFIKCFTHWFTNLG